MALGLTIAGVDRTTKLRMVQNVDVRYTLGSGATMRCEILDSKPDTTTAYRPTPDQSIVLTNGAVTVFSGKIIKVRERALGEPNAYTVTALECVDTQRAFSQRLMKVTYPTGTLKSMVTGIVTTYLAGASNYNVTLDAGMANGPTLEAQAFDHVTAQAGLNRLSDLTQWVHRLLPTNVLEFFSPGSKTAAFTLTSSNSKIRGGVQWSKHRAKYVNRQFVLYGGTQQAPFTLTITGNGVTASWLLDPTGIETVTGEIVSQGYVSDPSSPTPNHPINTTQGAVTWSYNTTTNSLTRSPALGNGVVATFVYQVQYPQIASVEDPAEITANGPYEDLFSAPEIVTKVAAVELATGLLRRYKAIPREIEIKTWEGLEFPGTTFTITVPERTISGSWLITEAAIRDQPDAKFPLSYTYTCLEGTEAQDTWVDFWSGVTSVRGTTGGTVVISNSGPGGVGTVTGTGTAGTLTKWSTPTALADSLVTESGSAVTVAGTVAATSYTGIWLGTAIAAARGGTGLDTSASNGLPTINAGVWQANNVLTANRVLLAAASNAVASSANLTFSGSTLTVSDTIAAPANLNLVPVGDLILNPTGNDVLPATNYDINLGMLSQKYLTLHAAELWVETLVAQNTIATIGGRILVLPTNILTVDIGVGETTISVKYNNLANGDRVYMEADGKVEFMAVTSGPSGVGPYTYTVTRNLDGSGANQWWAGDAIANTGQTGNGFIDLYSVRGVRAGTEIGPSIVGNVRLSSTYDDWAPRWAIGNLNGLYSYGADTYGAAFGNPSATNITIDATNGIRIRSSTTNKLVADTSGNLSMTGDLTVGTAGILRTAAATALTTGTGIYMAGGTTPVFRVGVPGGNQVKWDGTDLVVVSASVNIDATGITLPAYTGGVLNTLYAYKFSSTQAGTNLIGVFGYENSGASQTFTQVVCSTNQASRLSSVMLLAANGTVQSTLDVTVTTANVVSCTISANIVDISTSTGLVTCKGVFVSEQQFGTDKWLRLAEMSSAPSTPTANTQVQLYMKADKMVIAFNRGGTVQYYTLDLAADSGTWAHSTTAP